MNMDQSDYFDDEDIISKTRRKKEAHAQQELGERLTGLPDSVLAELPLSDRLRAAIAEFKRLPPKRGAIKRQLQFIGKLMRDCDTEAINTQLESQAPSHKPVDTHKQTATELCRLIVEQGDEGIQRAMDEVPALDRQQVRQYLRNINAAKNEARRASAERRLLDYLLASCQP